MYLPQELTKTVLRVFRFFGENRGGNRSPFRAYFHLPDIGHETDVLPARLLNVDVHSINRPYFLSTGGAGQLLTYHVLIGILS